MKITRSSFYRHGRAFYNKGIAQAYRDAEKSAQRHRAPKALRKELRGLMRMFAMIAVAAVREELAA